MCLHEFNPKQQKLIQNGIKRECSRGHLVIYGNPQFVNYFKIRNKKPQKYVEGCPECGSRIVDYDKKHDELVCECGLVLSGPPHWIPPARWVKYPMGNKYDYSDIDKTYSSYEEDRVDYGTYVPEW